MRWISLADAVSGTVPVPPADAAALSVEYRAGRRVGVVTLGTRFLFFRRLWKAYYIPYASVSRLFRRVVAVPAKIGCCTTGEIRVENLVICALTQDGEERELAQVQLPGERAALVLMEELRRLAPRAAFGRPPRQDAGGAEEENPGIAAPDSAAASDRASAGKQIGGETGEEAGT